MRLVFLLIFTFLISCKFDLLSEKKGKQPEAFDLQPITSALNSEFLSEGPYKNSEAFLGSTKLHIVQGYTIASALGCLSEKIIRPLGIDLSKDNVSAADLLNVSNFYVISKNKIVASIKEETFSLKRILTEVGENTIRKTQEDSFAKSNFSINDHKGILKDSRCIAKIKEDLLSGTWMANYKQQFRITSCKKKPERTVHIVREAKISNILLNQLLPDVNQDNEIIQLWDIFLPKSRSGGKDQKVAYYVKVETNNFTEYIFMLQEKNKKPKQIASVKQGDIEMIVGALPSKLAGIPGKNEVWEIKLLPGVLVNPFLYLATAIIKTDSDQEEVRKAARILNPNSKTSPSCK